MCSNCDDALKRCAGNEKVLVVRRTGGAIADVSDEEVVEGIRLLAETEGIFAETAGGVTVAVTRKLLREGLIDPGAEVVLLNTGDGLKMALEIGAARGQRQVEALQPTVEIGLELVRRGAQQGASRLITPPAGIEGDDHAVFLGQGQRADR